MWYILLGIFAILLCLLAAYRAKKHKYKVLSIILVILSVFVAIITLLYYINQSNIKSKAESAIIGEWVCEYYCDQVDFDNSNSISDIKFNSNLAYATFLDDHTVKLTVGEPLEFNWKFEENLGGGHWGYSIADGAMSAVLIIDSSESTITETFGNLTICFRNVVFFFHKV